MDGVFDIFGLDVVADSENAARLDQAQIHGLESRFQYHSIFHLARLRPSGARHRARIAGLDSSIYSFAPIRRREAGLRNFRDTRPPRRARGTSAVPEGPFRAADACSRWRGC